MSTGGNWSRPASWIRQRLDGFLLLPCIETMQAHEERLDPESGMSGISFAEQVEKMEVSTVETGNLINSRLMGKTVALLSHALDYRSAKHSVITGNLANVDTPGYRPQELTFDQELRRAVDKDGLSMQKTDEKHFPRSVDLFNGKGSHTLESKELELGETNQLNIDKEMAKMVQNNLLYEASAKLLAKKFEAMRLVIEGRR